MKKLLILLTVLGLLATPAMAGTQLEKDSVHKHATRHVAPKHKTRKLTRRQKKHLEKKVAKRNARKHKVTV